MRAGLALALCFAACVATAQEMDAQQQTAAVVTIAETAILLCPGLEVSGSWRPAEV